MNLYLQNIKEMDLPNVKHFPDRYSVMLDGLNTKMLQLLDDMKTICAEYKHEQKIRNYPSLDETWTETLKRWCTVTIDPHPLMELKHDYDDFIFDLHEVRQNFEELLEFTEGLDENVSDLGKVRLKELPEYLNIKVDEIKEVLSSLEKTEKLLKVANANVDESRKIVMSNYDTQYYQYLMIHSGLGVGSFVVICLLLMFFKLFWMVMTL